MPQYVNQGTILMVEDDEVLLEFFEAVLSTDYLVLTASDLEQAKKILIEEDEVHALFCDLRLGKSSGLELLAWLQSTNPEMLQRTTILSGERISRPGGFDIPVITTPVDPDELLQAAHQVIRYYELPIIRKESLPARGFINSGMRGGSSDSLARERTIPLYLDKAPFRQALDMPDEDHIYVLLVDGDGQVLWRERGAISPDKRAALDDQLAQIAATDLP